VAERQPALADVRIENVTKRFDEVVAVDDLSLEIERGPFFAMLAAAGWSASGARASARTGSRSRTRWTSPSRSITPILASPTAQAVAWPA
jgi:hypothetical protein